MQESVSNSYQQLESAMDEIVQQRIADLQLSNQQTALPNPMVHDSLHPDNQQIPNLQTESVENFESAASGSVNDNKKEEMIEREGAINNEEVRVEEREGKIEETKKEEEKEVIDIEKELMVLDLQVKALAVPEKVEKIEETEKVELTPEKKTIIGQIKQQETKRRRQNSEVVEAQTQELSRLMELQNQCRDLEEQRKQWQAEIDFNQNNNINYDEIIIKLAKTEEEYKKLMDSEQEWKHKAILFRQQLQEFHFFQFLTELKNITPTKKPKCNITCAWDPEEREILYLQKTLMKMKKDLAVLGIEVVLELQTTTTTNGRYSSNSRLTGDYSRILVVSLLL